MTLVLQFVGCHTGVRVDYQTSFLTLHFTQLYNCPLNSVPVFPFIPLLSVKKCVGSRLPALLPEAIPKDIKDGGMLRHVEEQTETGLEHPQVQDHQQ